MIGLAFDILLAVALVWLTRQALLGPHLFRDVVLFITVGLLVALAWVRLNAPDLGLAEAAVGAGLTGVLLLDALGRISRGDKDGQGKRRRGKRHE
ncbi:hydrogenase subunit MbhD domain-containing protein [Telmatospirillum sp. J64-1]|uniref:Na(+)/H(+) antiporter subunit B n=1 Tax=Telmatospirillum sp. J64-1 TaxID=2502183 RepID=UPI00115CC727|nr:hydrogenase subunit MbhD domain-containing protein [Telmatospirillum sp. J64-1]